MRYNYFSSGFFNTTAYCTTINLKIHPLIQRIHHAILVTIRRYFPKRLDTDEWVWLVCIWCVCISTAYIIHIYRNYYYPRLYLCTMYTDYIKAYYTLHTLKFKLAHCKQRQWHSSGCTAYRKSMRDKNSILTSKETRKLE